METKKINDDKSENKITHSAQISTQDTKKHRKPSEGVVDSQRAAKSWLIAAVEKITGAAQVPDWLEEPVTQILDPLQLQWTMWTFITIKVPVLRQSPGSGISALCDITKKCLQFCVMWSCPSCHTCFFFQPLIQFVTLLWHHADFLHSAVRHFFFKLHLICLFIYFLCCAAQPCVETW